MPFYHIFKGDVRQRLAEIEDESIDVSVTSPPYFGLRDYKHADQLGREPTLEAYLDGLVAWMKELERVSKPTGSIVLNLGDNYVRFASNAKDNEQTKRENDGGPADGKFQKHNAAFRKEMGGIYREKMFLSVTSYAYCRIIEQTNLTCRNEFVWLKPNVPTPIRSRLKYAHEKLFWFVKKSDDYYFDKKPWMRQAIARDGKEDFTSGVVKRGERLTRRDVDLRSVSKKLRATVLDAEGAGRTAPASMPLRKDAGAARLSYSGKGKVRLDEHPTAEGHGKTSLLHAGNPRYETKWDYAGAEEKTDGSAFPNGSFHAYVPETIASDWAIIPVGERQAGFEAHGRVESEHVAPFPEGLIRPWVESLSPPPRSSSRPVLGKRDDDESRARLEAVRDWNRNQPGLYFVRQETPQLEERRGRQRIRGEIKC